MAQKSPFFLPPHLPTHRHRCHELRQNATQADKQVPLPRSARFEIPQEIVQLLQGVVVTCEIRPFPSVFPMFVPSLSR